MYDIWYHDSSSINVWKVKRVLPLHQSPSQ